MVNLCSILLVLIFLFLSGIHFYWAVGGKWGGEAALPKNREGKNVLNPKKIDTIVVGFLLLFIAFFYFQKMHEFLELPPKLYYANWILPTLFLLRAIGEFKYFGFFKKVKESKFAYYDSRFYSPLCVLIAILMLIVATNYF